MIESLAAEKKQNKLYFILKTGGGSAETVEKMVTVIRHHYDEVNFIVPEYAMSAGTILCMSGDNILMDYSSCLGPIDPQVFNGSNWVPALNYIDKVKEMVDKSFNDTLTQAEFLILKDIDLALLKQYEQARDLTVDLLKNWLVKYKFKDWEKTLSQKESAAEGIAKKLGDTSLWKSHGRPISMSVLVSQIRLKIEDIESHDSFKIIRQYNDLLCDYHRSMGSEVFFHSRLL